MHTKVSRRDVKLSVQMMLWGKAGGRCEFNGCNHLLWKSHTTQESVNIAQKAHIYAFSPAGPRGNREIPKKKLHDIENLMLVCDACHKTIDQDKKGIRYSAELLQRWKIEHERRIEIQTGISPNKKSHVLFYGAKIGQVDSTLSFNSAAIAMFPDRYPADDKAIELSTINSSFEDCGGEFWQTEEANLITKYKQRVGERLAERSIHHLSVFALAPQPLLIRLGSLLTDINEVQVYTRSREPQGWQWRKRPPGFRYIVQDPKQQNGSPALILSLSANVSDDRIKEALGRRITFWRVTIPRPNNDFLKSKSQLREFRDLVRDLMVKIKNMHGQKAVLNIFPAVPAAIAVEIGRIRQPKADLRWQIWDQIEENQPFIRAIEII
jgi:hypothetical protein